MKGIILAGGSGTRLYPVTRGISKQLAPVYDKPMIYYPLSILMLAGIKDIAIITTPHDQDAFKRLLGDGSKWGLNFEYIKQASPDGLAQAFILAEDFIKGDNVCLILGDNIFYGHDLSKLLINAKKSVEANGGAAVLAYQVADPERYGVIEFDDKDLSKVVSIEEKPTNPKSDFAITGLYFYDSNVCDLAKKIKPSARGELEISSLNQLYLDKGALKSITMGRGYAWFDTGTYESIMEASLLISSIEKRQGLKIGCPEEIAYHNKWINKQQLSKIAEGLSKNNYGKYLKGLL
jgi:glucose-1-phosphate thymidylyltransferase